MFELTKENFEEEVKQAEGYIFIDFWSQSCEPCKALMPDVHKLAEKYADSAVKFCSFDTTKAKRLCIKEKVMGLPTLAIYKDGEKVDEIVKEDANIPNIEEMIKKYI
ncbi:MAG: thioredoxin family protein [Clostridioides sp.]|jgi:thioredoxin 1|nr:thioredoxin family protein [Clostridioides sp.]